MSLDPAAVATAAAVMAAGVAGAAYLVRGVVRWARKLGHLADDIIGEPARPETGEPERPGLMRRLSNIEADQRASRAENREVARRLDEHLDMHAGFDRPLNGLRP